MSYRCEAANYFKGFKHRSDSVSIYFYLVFFPKGNCRIAMKAMELGIRSLAWPCPTRYQRQAQSSLGLCPFGLLSLSVMLTSLKGDVGTGDSVFKQLWSGPKSTLSLGTLLQWGPGQGGRVPAVCPRAPLHLPGSFSSLPPNSLWPCLTSPDVAGGREGAGGHKPIWHEEGSATVTIQTSPAKNSGSCTFPDRGMPHL